jgi:hypothetical protein
LPFSKKALPDLNAASTNISKQPSGYLHKVLVTYEPKSVKNSLFVEERALWNQPHAC